ncbi:MAG: L-threonylcarbamoyladenylate synthase [Candidatus Hodarchaeales archaeon]|jgi:L-threonylcarbamoyladenylate synthase
MTTIFSIHMPNYLDLLEQTSKILHNGEVIAFPTETVYGLGANAFNQSAVNKIFEIKGRPSDNPMIVHIHSKNLLSSVADMQEIKKLNLTATLNGLIQAFWPGALTLILPKNKNLPNNVTANLNTVGVRIPSHPIALDLLKKVNLPIAAPSANISGFPSPTTVEDVIEDLYGKIPVIIDGGKCEIGLESTVLDLTQKIPKIFRPGGVTIEELRKFVGKIVFHDVIENITKSPGLKYRHYSPKASVKVFQGLKANIYLKMNELTEFYHKEDKKVGLIVSEHSDLFNADYIKIFGKKSNHGTKYLASILFHELREMDRRKIDIILVEAVEKKGIGVAVMNRLKKSANNQIINI